MRIVETLFMVLFLSTFFIACDTEKVNNDVEIGTEEEVICQSCIEEIPVENRN